MFVAMSESSADRRGSGANKRLWIGGGLGVLIPGDRPKNSASHTRQRLEHRDRPLRVSQYSRTDKPSPTCTPGNVGARRVKSRVCNSDGPEAGDSSWDPPTSVGVHSSGGSVFFGGGGHLMLWPRLGQASRREAGWRQGAGRLASRPHRHARAPLVRSNRAHTPTQSCRCQRSGFRSLPIRSAVRSLSEQV